MDGVARLRRRPGARSLTFRLLEQRGIENLFLGFRVRVQKRGQPRPHRRQAAHVGARNLFQDREQATLFMVVVQYQLSDIQTRASLQRGRASLRSRHHARVYPGRRT